MMMLENIVKIIHHGLAKLMQEFLPRPMHLEIISLHQWGVATVANMAKIKTLTLIQVTVMLKFYLINSNLPILNRYDDSKDLFH